MSHTSRSTFEEKRIRSKSADPFHRFRKTNIFNYNQDCKELNETFSKSEYKKAFAWPKVLSKLTDENQRGAAGLSSARCAAKQVHIVHNSNGSTSIIEPTEFAQTTASATNLILLNESEIQEKLRPFTSLAYIDSNKLDTFGNDKKNINKSATINNLNEWVDSTKKLNQKSNSSKIEYEKENILNQKNDIQNVSNSNHYESIYGKNAGASVLFNKEPIDDQKDLNKIPKKTEYKSKFKPFSTYVYVSGKGWLKPKDLKVKEKKIVNEDAVDKIVNRAISNDKSKNSELKAEPWYKEVLERNTKANEFRNRSEFGNPILGRKSLEEIYKKVSDNHWHACNDIKLTNQLKTRNTEFISLNTSSKKSDQSLKPFASNALKPNNKTSLKSRAVSVPPRNKKTITAPAKSNTTKNAGNYQDTGKKVWIKSKKEENIPAPVCRPVKTTNNQTDKNDNKTITHQSIENTTNNASDRNNLIDGLSSPPPIINSATVRTTNIQTPENLIGIKSPPPENWLVQVDQDVINWQNSTDPSVVNNPYNTIRANNELKELLN